MIYPFQPIPKSTFPAPAVPPPFPKFPFPALKKTVLPPYSFADDGAMFEKSPQKQSKQTEPKVVN
jgi:hypothetical protein